jgi:hypothetical protein
MKENYDIFLSILEIIECPHRTDEATVPKAGIPSAGMPGRKQVVLEYSIGIARIDKAVPRWSPTGTPVYAGCAGEI